MRLASLGAYNPYLIICNKTGTHYMKKDCGTLFGGTGVADPWGEKREQLGRWVYGDWFRSWVCGRMFDGGDTVLEILIEE